ncbi:MAG: hypothetical protein JSU96_00300 [Acidobacteriota bacterium]|nr:MAG: hypothetical protein JSU96_00300 [Acidobacteriota bacterium]
MQPFSRILITSTLTLAVWIPVLGFSAPAAGEFQLPTPGGPFTVGTRFLYWVDTGRPNQFTEEPDDFRAVSVQVWYPAESPTEGTPKSFNDRSAAEFWVKSGLFTDAFVSEVAERPSHSFLDVPIDNSAPAFPLVIYSASGVMDANILLAEELASQGYVVLALGHPHWCAYYFDADGKISFRDQKGDNYNRKMWAEETAEGVNQIKEALTAAKTAAEKKSLQEALNQAMPTQVSDIHLWAQDVGFVLDQLDLANRTDPFFKGRLDLEKVGVMGYSKGGAAAGETCLTEERCKAGVNLSGFMFGQIASRELTVPFMVMESIEPWCKDCLPINDLLFHNSQSSIYMVQIGKATHGNFTDLSALKRYLSEGSQSLLGTIDGLRFLEIQNGYVRQFFDRHLKGLPAPLLDASSSPYEEVRFKSRHPQGVRRPEPPRTKTRQTG